MTMVMTLSSSTGQHFGYIMRLMLCKDRMDHHGDDTAGYPLHWMSVKC